MYFKVPYLEMLGGQSKLQAHPFIVYTAEWNAPFNNIWRAWLHFRQLLGVHLEWMGGSHRYRKEILDLYRPV